MATSALCRFALGSLVLASLTTGLTATAHAAAPGDAAGSAPVAALTANGMPSSGTHSLGFVSAPTHKGTVHVAALSTASLPASVDLSAQAPPVGDQGSVNSCTAWATGYYLRGWYARRDGYYPFGGPDGAGSFAPMYTYSQTFLGLDVGSTFGQNLDIQKSQGIDSRADYTQGDLNFSSQPTAAERANATKAKIYSYDVAEGPGDFVPVALQSYIESKLAGGDPVAIAIPIYPEFDNASASQPLVTAPTARESWRGRHAVAAFKYDATGVWIENQWGTGWGLNGWAELSWDFINRYAYEVASIVPLSPLERFYNSSTQTHWVTSHVNDVTSGYHYERTLGLVFPTQQSGTVALYDCLAATGSNDHFLSFNIGCEGRVRYGLWLWDGYLYSSAPLFDSTVQVYRCLRIVNGHGDHFVSTDPHCEGYTTEASLGYLHT